MAFADPIKSRGRAPATESNASTLSRVVLVTGKGGVGKTTVAAGLAVSAARDGGAVLIEFGDGEAGRRALGRDARGVEHVVVEPQEAIDHLAGVLFNSKLIAKAVLGTRAVKRFVHAAPAVRELAMLECVRIVADANPHHRIIVDLPATGHGLAWLRVPGQVRRVLDTGPGHAIADRLHRHFFTDQRVSIVVVTLPERLVLSETIGLLKAIEQDVGLTPARLVVNRYPAELPAQALLDAQALAAREGGRTRAAAAALAEAIALRESARAEANAALAEVLRGERLAPAVLPESPRDPEAAQVADWLRKEQIR